MTEVFLGIDTSNYRTSLCLAREDGRIVAEARRLLAVKAGERGLQQSEAVFQHVHNLSDLCEQLGAEGWRIVGVCASERPRPRDGSYMPVFKVGESWARSLAALLRVPCYVTSHQEGHIAAGEHTAAKRPQADRFLAVHLSGGTSEILDCTRIPSGYRIEQVGGTRDLHAGQLIDRVGVALGLPFPAGPHLEELARAASGSFRVPSSVNGLSFSWSGPETALLRAVEKGEVPPPEIARAAEQCIANTLEKALRNAVAGGWPRDILIVGGVAANQYIRQRLIHRLEHQAVQARLYFCDPAYTGDNAYGVAMLGWAQHKNRILHNND